MCTNLQLQYWRRDNNVSLSLYYSRRRIPWSKEKAARTPVRKQHVGDRAIYRGDELLGIGSIKECAEQSGYSISYIKHLSTPSYKKKLSGLTQEKRDQATVSILIDMEEEEEL